MTQVSDLSHENTGRVPVYQLNEDSEYVVAFADVMHNDNKSRIVDSVVARNDVTGTTINGCKFDEATGLLYIPRTAFVIDNTCYIGMYTDADIICNI